MKEMKTIESILDEMIKQIKTNLVDYVFVMNKESYKHLGNEYKGMLIRRFILIKKGEVFLTHDPIYKE